MLHQSIPLYVVYFGLLRLALPSPVPEAGVELGTFAERRKPRSCEVKGRGHKKEIEQVGDGERPRGKAGKEQAVEPMGDEAVFQLSTLDYLRLAQ